MNVSKHIEYIDGLKGLACLTVFLHHFCLAFLPAIYYGDVAPSHLEGIDAYLSQSPLLFFLNGNFAVFIFCLISGFVISKQVMSLRDKADLADIVIKRYLRLMLPLLPVGLLVFVILQFDGFTNLQAAELTGSLWLGNYYQQDISLVQTLKSIFIDTWFMGDNKLSTAFWMLSELFYGTFLSVVLSTISWKKSKYTGGIYLFVASCFYTQHIQMTFVFGTLLSWIYLNKPKFFCKKLGSVFVIIGLFLGAYPSGVEPTNVYSLLSGRTFEFWHVIGAVLLLYGVFSCEVVQNVLSIRLCRRLGTISYAIYLVHIPILFMVSTSLFMLLHKSMEYLMAVGVTLLITSLILFIFAKIFYQVIEKRGVGLVNKFLSEYF